MDRTWSGAGDTVPLMQQTRAAPPATLDAVLERITYANQETGYTVARVATARSSDLLTVVGPLLGAQPGEGLRLRGRWASHPQYGRQFQVEAYITVLPATIQGIRRYLGSGLIKGIGPKMAERIVDHFGQATLEVIEQAAQGQSATTPAAPAPLRGWGAWLLARNAAPSLPFLNRSMGGVGPTLRPPRQPIGPRAGAQQRVAPVAAPGGSSPGPRGRNALRRQRVPRQPSRLGRRLEGHDRIPPCLHRGEDGLLVLLLDLQLLERGLQMPDHPVERVGGDVELGVGFVQIPALILARPTGHDGQQRQHVPAQPVSVLVVQVFEVGQQQRVSQHPQIQRVDQPQQPTGVPDPLVQRRR
jgi:hypothetical protein